MNNFYEAELDFYVSIGDAFNRGRVSLYMTEATFNNLKEKLQDSKYGCGIHYDKDNLLMYKNHPIIIDDTFNSYRVIKIPTIEEDLYYSWWC